jgi:hypothetical protein
MPPTDLIKIEDDSLMARAMGPRGKKLSLAETVPEDIDPREALANIKALVGGIKRAGGVLNTMGALLGAHMAVAAKRPEIYEKAGYKSLREFEKAEIIDKVSHGSVWNYKGIAEAFPEATIEQVLQTGSTNLIKAVRAVKSIKASPAQSRKIFDKAGEMNTTDFAGWLQKSTGVSSGDTSLASFELIGPANEIADLKEDFAEPRFQEFAGCTTPLGMVRAAVDESKDLWPKNEALQVGEAGEGWG